jgi:hypothetical protein
LLSQVGEVKRDRVASAAGPDADAAYDAASVVRSRAIAPGRPRTFMIRPTVS